MKTHRLPLLLLLTSPLLLQADDLLPANVPAAVRGYVEQHHARATAVEWDFEKNENVYEADFRIDGLEHELKLSPTGELVFSEIDLPLSSLPAAVTAYLKSEYAKATLLGAKQVVRAGQLKYEIALIQSGLFGKKHKTFT